MGNKEDQTSIGRTKTVIVAHLAGEPIAVITEIFAQETLIETGRRLEFRGPVKLDEKARHHTETIILPMVDQIIQSLGLPLKNFVISISNIGLSATKGVGLSISGFSADLALFVAILSAHLQLGLRQDIIATGHISSLSGDVAPVLDIPAKIEAAVAAGDITEFLLPEFEKDRSITHLMDPEEVNKTNKALSQYQCRIKLTFILNIFEAIQAFIPEESVLRAALSQGFFGTKLASIDPNNPVSKSITFLLDGNEKRFWEITRGFLFGNEAVKAKKLINLFIDFYLGQAQYPKNLGEQLYRQAMSLPIPARKLDGLFPLVMVEQCIALSQLAKPTDYTDVQMLYKLICEDDFVKEIEINHEEPSPDGTLVPEEELLRKILFQISDANLTKKIGGKLDDALAVYSFKIVKVKDATEFNKAIASFYIHLMSFTQSPETHISYDIASSEAIDLISKAFGSRGGYEAALYEATTASNGGLRTIFDQMTNFTIKQSQDKFKIMVIKESIDSDWDLKVKMSAHILKQYRVFLPESLKNLQPEQIAHNLEEAILLLSDKGREIDRWISRY